MRVLETFWWSLLIIYRLIIIMHGKHQNFSENESNQQLYESSSFKSNLADDKLNYNEQ